MQNVVFLQLLGWISFTVGFKTRSVCFQKFFSSQTECGIRVLQNL